jgi:ATP-dependent protease ClpP protease subunit
MFVRCKKHFTMSKKKYTGFYNIIKNEATKEATIYIYGVIGGFDWDTYEYINTDKKFVQEFKDLEETFPVINVRLNTPGGDIHQGTPIVNAIRSSSSHINIYVDGIAYSMGAEIAISGNTLYMYDNSRLMFHNSSTGAWGNAQELRTQADVLDSYDKSLAPLLANKLNISEEEAIEKYLNFKDNYFTAKEAKDEGFADVVLSNSSDEVPENIDNLSPEAIIQHYAKMNFAKEEVTPKPKNTKKMNKEIKAPSIQNVLGYETPFQSTDEGVFLQEAEVVTVEAALTTANTNVTNITAERDTANTNVAAANTTIDAALKGAEIEFTPEMSVSEKVTLLENQRKEFAGKSGGGKTGVPNGGDDGIDGAAKQKVYAHNEEAKKLLNI